MQDVKLYTQNAPQYEGDCEYRISSSNTECYSKKQAILIGGLVSSNYMYIQDLNKMMHKIYISKSIRVQ